MNRIQNLCITSLVWLFPIAISFANQPPNIVMIFTDDQRSDAVGYSGNDVISTPHIDSLANQGVIFDNCFVNTSICAISRANLLLGQYPSQHGIDDFFKTPSPRQLAQSVPALLQKNGYQTAFFGKWGIGDTVDATLEGTAVFDFWAGQPMQTCFFHQPDCAYVVSNGFTAKGRGSLCNCPADSANRKGFRNRIGVHGLKNPLHTDSEVVPMHVDRFLDGRSSGKPVCMFVHFKAPHSPFSDWDREFAKVIAGRQMPIPPSATNENAENEPDVIKKSLGRASGMTMLKHPDQLIQHMEDYYRLVASMDKGVGKIVESMKQRGLHDNTIYLFTSDNGHLKAEHGLMGKWVMYEPSLAVPGFLFDARSPKGGQHVKPMVITTDFSVTMLSAAGVEVPKAMVGENLMRIYEDPKADLEWRDDFFYDHPYEHRGAIPHIQGIREERFVYIRYISEDPAVEQLFDLQNDPDQLNNLVGDPMYQSKLEAMRKRWKERRDSLLP